MKIYLYLTEIEWAKAWVNGGKVPIQLASHYLGDERIGTTTPDENLLYESNINLKDLEKYGFYFEKSIENISITGMTSNNSQMVPDTFIKNYRHEDGAILSFSNSLDKAIAERLGNKKCCVEIVNMDKLIKAIDKQLNVTGVIGKCMYTDSFQRNHFLKSVDDSWQDEYRIFWKIDKPIEVELPKGIANFVAVFEH